MGGASFGNDPELRVLDMYYAVEPARADLTTINVLVALTPDSRERFAEYRTDISVEEAVGEQIDITNYAFARSGIPGQLALAGIVTVDYPGDDGDAFRTGDVLAALADPDDGRLDVLGNELAVRYSADIIAVIPGKVAGFGQACYSGTTGEGEFGLTPCGSSYGIVMDVATIALTGSQYATPSTSAFSVCYNDLNFTFAHEVGHILGAGHNLAVAMRTRHRRGATVTRITAYVPS